MIVHDCIQGSPEWHALRYGLLTASRAGQLFTPGGEPRLPTYYRPVQDATEPPSRAPKQREMFHWLLTYGRSPLESSPSRDALLRDGRIEECAPPPDAKPIGTPVRLSDQRDRLIAALVHERITQSPVDDVSNKWVEHGRALEPQAAAAFRDMTGEDAQPVGIITDDAQEVGVSPDLWIPGEALVELKCPAGWTHVAWRMAGGLPRAHVLQVQFGLWVTGLPRAYFLSYAASPHAGNWLPEWKPGAYMAPYLVEVAPEARYQDAFSEHVPTFVAEVRAALELFIEEGWTEA